MNYIAWQMLTGDRAKYFALVFTIAFASFLLVQQVSIFVGILERVVDAPKTELSLDERGRISWDGRQRSLRMMRVLLSGCMYAPVRPTPRSYGS